LFNLNGSKSVTNPRRIPLSPTANISTRAKKISAACSKAPLSCRPSRRKSPRRRRRRRLKFCQHLLPVGLILFCLYILDLSLSCSIQTTMLIFPPAPTRTWLISGVFHFDWNIGKFFHAASVFLFSCKNF
jgi:hypothetical protein